MKNNELGFENLANLIQYTGKIKLYLRHSNFYQKIRFKASPFKGMKKRSIFGAFRRMGWRGFLKSAEPLRSSPYPIDQEKIFTIRISSQRL